jgi:capsular exopolysaccharide synthesis family protein
MDKIKKALQKAKEQRAQTNQLSNNEPEAPEVVLVKEPVKVDDKKIQYSKTAQLELNKGVLESNRIIGHDKSDERSIAFDILRTRVLQLMKKNNWRSVAITSPTSKCGKTLISCNLSLSLAQQHEHSVLLADFDFRRPTVAKYLGIQHENGLSNYVKKECEIPDVFVNPNIPGFVVLPNYEPIPHAAETLMTKRMQSLVEDIKNRYDDRLVIFDLPPLLSTDDSIAFIPQVDCVLLVVTAGLTTETMISDSLHQLHSANVLGVVLNKSDEKVESYYS